MFSCDDCGHSFYVPGTNLPLVIEGGCPDCGGNARPERDQPSPTKSDGELRDMVDPYTGDDSGGNPMQEGILGTTDGGWAPGRKRDESFASVQVPSTEWVTPMRIHPVASNQTPQMPWAFAIDEVAEPGMDNEDAEEKINGDKKSNLLGDVGGAAGTVGGGMVGQNAGAALGTMVAPGIGTAVGAIGGRLLGGAIGHLMGGALGGAFGGGDSPGADASTPPEQEARPLEMMAAEKPGFPSPGGTAGDTANDDEHPDPKEHDDGDTDGTSNDLSVNDIGGTASPHGFDENGAGLQRAEWLLPLILHYFNSDESGSEDPLIRALHECLEMENPGYLHKPSDPDAVAHVLKIVMKPEGKGESDKSENSLPDSDSPDENSSKDTENQPSKTASDHQGPHSPEQIAAVQQLLMDQGRASEVPNVPIQPWMYANEMAQVANSPDLPPQDTTAEQPQPAQEEAPPENTMPMPGMTAPPLGQMQSHRTADEHAQTGGHAPIPCEHCGGSLVDGSCPNCKTSHDHSHPGAQPQGVPAADQLGQEDRSQEQDSSGQWQTDDGQPLIVGEQYELHTPGVDIPDIVRVKAVKPDSVTLEFTGAYELGFAKEVTRQEFQIEGYSFSHVTGDTPEANSPVEQQQATYPSDSSFQGMSTGLGTDPANRPLSKWKVTATFEDFRYTCPSCLHRGDTQGGPLPAACPSCGIENHTMWNDDPELGYRLNDGGMGRTYDQIADAPETPHPLGHQGGAKEAFMPGAPGGNQPGGVCSQCGGPLQPDGSCAGCERGAQAPGAPGVPATPAVPQNPNGGRPQQQTMIQPFGTLPGGANASRPPKSVNGPASYSASTVPSVDPETGIQLDAEAQALIARLMRNASMDPQAEEPVADPTPAPEGMEWLREAGAQYTPNEQRDLIDEEGEARNSDKLDLSNTHYESRRSISDDASFLW